MSDAQVLGVFVKAPVAGRVKTRLAADVGPARAAELYRHLGRHVVAATIADTHQTVVWYAPRAGGRLVRAWLDGLDVSRFHPQPGGNLGRRLHAAFARHFSQGAGRVVIIGSDCPDVDRWMIGDALTALDRHDVVLGPAWDGGYYLLGMKAPHDALFQRIPWSTAAVLELTLDRARQLGLGTALLPTLRDVDTAADARAAGIITSQADRLTREAVGAGSRRYGETVKSVLPPASMLKLMTPSTSRRTPS